MPSLRSERVHLARSATAVNPLPGFCVRSSPTDSPPFCKSSWHSIECPRCARNASTSRTVTRGRQPAGAGPLLRAGPLGDCRGRPCGKPLQPAGRLALRSTLQVRRPRAAPLSRRTVPDGRRAFSRPRAAVKGHADKGYEVRTGSGSGNSETARVEMSSVAEHRAGNVE